MGAGAIIQLITLLLPVIEKDGPLVWQGLHDLIVWVESSVQSNPTALQSAKVALLSAANAEKGVA